MDVFCWIIGKELGWTKKNKCLLLNDVAQAVNFLSIAGKTEYIYAHVTQAARFALEVCTVTCLFCYLYSVLSISWIPGSNMWSLRCLGFEKNFISFLFNCVCPVYILS